jgi:hypothetical protein
MHSIQNMYSISPGLAPGYVLSYLNLRINGSLVNWTVVSMAASKFKHVIFCVEVRLSNV